MTDDVQSEDLEHTEDPDEDPDEVKPEGWPSDPVPEDVDDE